MLIARRKAEIEKIVNQVLEKYNITECPAKKLEIIMKGENILFLKNSFDDDNFDGLLMKNNDNQFCIYINTKINYSPRHNFTIAHELGHYFLKHELKDGSLICNRYAISEDNNENNDTIEQEANYFAANLLMPTQMFLKSYEKITKKLDRYRYGRIYVDNQPSNYREWKMAFCYFYYDFRISILALKYRLEYFNLVEFNWSDKTWNKSVEDYFEVSYKQ